jgi:hypothetical protein
LRALEAASEVVPVLAPKLCPARIVVGGDLCFVYPFMDWTSLRMEVGDWVTGVLAQIGG